MQVYSVILFKTEMACQVNNMLNLPVTCMVSCAFCDVLVGSLRLSWFMFSKHVSALRAGCAEEGVLFWCRVLLGMADRGLDKVAEVLKVLGSPGCSDRCSVAFPCDLCVESTWLFNTAGCLEDFELMFWVFSRALHTLFSGWTAWVPVCDVMGWCFSLVVLELLGWEKLNGTGLVHGFFFLAFPCIKMIEYY